MFPACALTELQLGRRGLVDVAARVWQSMTYDSVGMYALAVMRAGLTSLNVATYIVRPDTLK